MAVPGKDADLPAVWGPCKRFQLGDCRFSPVTGKLLVVNQSPHIPFHLDCERSAFSTLLQHVVWPNGEEAQLLVGSDGQGVPAVRALADRLRDLRQRRAEGELSPLEALVRHNEELQATLDTQGEPARGHEGGGPSDEEEDGTGEQLVDADEDNWPFDLDGMGLTCEGQIDPQLAYTEQSGDMQGALVLDADNFAAAVDNVNRLKRGADLSEHMALSQVLALLSALYISAFSR
jgi:hypothetical protein